MRNWRKEREEERFIVRERECARKKERERNERERERYIYREREWEKEKEIERENETNCVRKRESV